MAAQTPRFRLEDYAPTPYVILQTYLTFQLEAKGTHITARLEIERRDKTAPVAPLVLDGDELTLLSIKINGTDLAQDLYRASAQKLEIFSPPALPFTLEMVTKVNPQDNKKLMGLYQSNSVFCTQCEAEGFRRMTYFYDRPDVLSIFTVRIEADKTTCPVLLSNGNCQGNGLLDDNRHYALWHDPFPKPAYLFALVAGNLEALQDHYTTATGKTVELAIYVEKGKASRTAYAMDSLKRSMRWDEEKFGCEYDLSVFNIVAVSDFNMGAMENKGLNIFNDRYILADKLSETDSDFANVERVVAHEYFHNWTGNRITCRDWFQLCLKEGLTVYRDQEFSSDARSRAVSRIENVRLLQAAQFPEDAGPLAHPVRPRQYSEINNFYTTTIYEKGAEVVRMIATWLGEKQFRAGMDLYFSRHDGQACTIEDFITCFAQTSNYDFSQFMLWYEQAGTPHVEAKFGYDATSQRFTLELEQDIPPTPGQPSKQPMLIPLRFALLGKDGKEMSYLCDEDTQKNIADDVLLLRERHQVFRFKGLSHCPVPSLLRGFSAPIILKTPLTTQDLAFLAYHDTDEVNRWLSLNRLCLHQLVADGQTHFSTPHKTNEEETERAILIDLMGKIGADDTLEPAFRAMALTLPSEAEIAREIAIDVDPDQIFAARTQLILDIAQSHAQNFDKIIKNLSSSQPYSPAAQDAGRRTLANILLDYTSRYLQDPEFSARLYATADNMTDQIAALRILCLHFGDSSACQRALADFEQRFSHDALVMDKWFSVQACRPGAQALHTVKHLMNHPLFVRDNPNRVRALIGTFASVNQTGFNRIDGQAYQFFATFLLETDKSNPQLAARLLTILRSWRTFEPIRRNNIATILDEIAAASNLSTDMRDIVERIRA